MEDFLFHHTFSPDNYHDRANHALLLNNPFDKMVNSKQKAAMRLLCPSVSDVNSVMDGILLTLLISDSHNNCFKKNKMDIIESMEYL